MSITQEIRRDSSLKITPVQKMLYRGSNSGRKLFEIATKCNLDIENKYDDFASIIGDIILGFYKIEDTVPLLQQELGIDPKTAALLGAEVLDFLAPLSDPNFVVPVEPDEETDGTPVPPVPVQAQNPGPYTTPSSVSPILHELTNNPAYQKVNIPPMPVNNPIPELRTMAADMNQAPAQSAFAQINNPENIPTYQSQQPEINNQFSTPTYSTPTVQTPAEPTAPITPPRWGS